MVRKSALSLNDWFGRRWMALSNCPPAYVTLVHRQGTLPCDDGCCTLFGSSDCRAQTAASLVRADRGETSNGIACVSVRPPYHSNYFYEVSHYLQFTLFLVQHYQFRLELFTTVFPFERATVCHSILARRDLPPTLSYFAPLPLRYGPGSSVGIATELRAGQSCIEFRLGRDFLPVQTGTGAHPASCKMGTGSFPGVKCGRGVLVTTHPILVPRSWKSRAIPLPTLWVTPVP